MIRVMQKRTNTGKLYTVIAQHKKEYEFKNINLIKHYFFTSKNYF